MIPIEELLDEPENTDEVIAEIRKRYLDKVVSYEELGQMLWNNKISMPEYLKILKEDNPVPEPKKKKKVVEPKIIYEQSTLFA